MQQNSDEFCNLEELNGYYNGAIIAHRSLTELSSHHHVCMNFLVHGVLEHGELPWKASCSLAYPKSETEISNQPIAKK